MDGEASKRSLDARQPAPHDVRQPAPRDERSAPHDGQPIPRDVRQSLPHDVRQSLPRDVRQSLPHDVRQPSPRRRFGLPRGRRLRKRREFLHIQESSSARVTTAHLVLLLAAPPAPGPGRLGIVASKKVGGAAQRNRAKRLIREAFRTRPPLFPAGVDLVVIARPGAPGLDLAAVCAEIERVSGLLARRAREVLRK